MEHVTDVSVGTDENESCNLQNICTDPSNRLSSSHGLRMDNKMIQQTALDVIDEVGALSPLRNKLSLPLPIAHVPLTIDSSMDLSECNAMHLFVSSSISDAELYHLDYSRSITQHASFVLETSQNSKESLYLDKEDDVSLQPLSLQTQLLDISSDKEDENTNVLSPKIISEITDIVNDCIQESLPQNVMFYLENDHGNANPNMNNNSNGTSQNDNNDDNDYSYGDGGGNYSNTGGQRDGNHGDDGDDKKKRENGHNIMDDDDDDDDDDDEEEKDDKKEGNCAQTKLNVNAPSFEPDPSWTRLRISVSPPCWQLKPLASSTPNQLRTLSSIDENTPSYDNIKTPLPLSLSKSFPMAHTPTTPSNNIITQYDQKKRKKNVSHKRLLSNQCWKNYHEYPEYNPHPSYGVKGKIQIDRTFTDEIVPSAIEEDIQHVYCYMDKRTALRNMLYGHQYIYKDKVRIFNYDFHEKDNSKRILYGVAVKSDEAKYHKYKKKWKMIHKLFSADDIKKEYDVLPKDLPLCLYHVLNTNSIHLNEITNKINNNIKSIIHESKWNKIAVYSNEPQRRVYRSKLSLNVTEFRNALNGVENKKYRIYPILMFRNGDNGKCRYCLQYLVVVTMNIHDNISTDIGIAFEWESTKAVGIHLDKNNIINSHQAVDPTSCIHNLKMFKSKYDDLHIGNVDEDENYIKDLLSRFNALKKKVESLTPNSSSSLSYINMIQQSPVSSDNSHHTPLQSNE